MLKPEKWGWGWTFEPISDFRHLAALALHNDFYEEYAKLARRYWDAVPHHRKEEWRQLENFWLGRPDKLTRVDQRMIFKHWAFTTGAYREVADD